MDGKRVLNAGPGMGFEIVDRFATDADIQAILNCDSVYSNEMLGGEWKPRDFKQCLRGEDMAIIVAEAAGVFAGYMVVESFRKSFEIHRLVVNHLLMRAGVGTALVHSLKKRLSMYGMRELNVDVPEENLRAQLFFKSIGFKAKLPIAKSNSGSVFRFSFAFMDLFSGRS